MLTLFVIKGFRNHIQSLSLSGAVAIYAKGMGVDLELLHTKQYGNSWDICDRDDVCVGRVDAEWF